MRPTASIVIPVWNDWAATEACLRSLRPTIGPGDEVIVVDNHSEDQTAVELARLGWITVVTNEANRGFAAACNQGADRARGDVVVFLNNDTVVPHGWIDALLEPFADPDVGATGPRSNFVAGPQLVHPVGYDLVTLAGYAEWVEGWRAAHAGGRTAAMVLIGFCLAVRRTALEQVGTFDEGFGIGGYEDTDLSLRLNDGGWRLLIVDDAFVHHVGHRTFDANELDWYAIQEANRPRFEANQLPPGPLLSVAIVVRDDEAELGACLRDLGRLADEVVVYDAGSSDGSAAAARAAGAVVLDGCWDGDVARARNAALAACRGRWVLTLDPDERVAADAARIRDALTPPLPVDVVSVPVVSIVGGAGGPRRGPSGSGPRILRRARCRWAPGGAIVAVPGGPGQAPTHVATLRPGSLAGVEIIRDAAVPAASRADGAGLEAQDWIAVTWRHALAGDGAAALTSFGRALGCHPAADLLVGELLAAVDATGGDVAIVASLLPVDALEAGALALAVVGPLAADRFLEALWSRFGGVPALLAGAAFAGPRLPVDRARVWSERLRAHGASELCPLQAIADDADRPEPDRREARRLTAVGGGADHQTW